MDRPFPSVLDILTELVRIGAHTLEAQRRMAQWLHDFAKEWQLGDVRLASYPTDLPYASAHPEQCNVVIDIGDGREELMIWHGHFDVVPPDSYPADHDPCALRKLPEPDLYAGLGSYDMLGGIAAILVALHDVTIAPHRRIRVILVGQEEDQSQGTFAASHSTMNLFEGATCAVSTELLVGGKLTDSPQVVIGRPGRVGLDVRIQKEQLHVGSVTRDMFEQLAVQCDAKAKLAAMDIRLPHHPHDALHLLSHPLVAVRGWGSSQPKSLSVAGEAWFNLQIHYTDPDMTPEDVRRVVEKHLIPIVGDGLSVQMEHGRVTPLCRPWLEKHDSAYVRTMADIASSVAAEHGCGTVELKAGGGVADETILAHEHGIPVVCIPSTGEGEHTPHERVNLRSIEEYQVPVLRAIAGFPGKLV